ncbi:MAG: GDP-mannose 4,6-dehydratase [Patescibacteria group bacterium]|nr:GDP-mannose 4,6-dehydratase [Patescibacteria group bacterium]MDE2172641.1 GDP-mannose 4,6-dehydratase [Patescibacteria group bacterium]
MQERILVTGGLGFIGSHFVELALSKGYFVINVDKMTYAIREDLDFEKHKNYRFVKRDICDLRRLPDNIKYIVNFAAESHVDNSIRDNSAFFHSNVRGVYNLLELVRKTPKEKRPVFVQISTDEVYGDILNGSFEETDRLAPSNPYSATKAAADQLVLGWTRTHGLRTRICRSSNNYGFGQRAEKLIPKTMKLAIKNQKVGVHGDGTYTREWTFVGDNCHGIMCVMEKGLDGEIYNISAGEELSNLNVVKTILKVYDRPADLYEFVKDRPGQDVRYSVDSSKIRTLGWKPQMTLEKYLPICKELNEYRRKNMPPGRKEKLLNMLGVYSKRT